MGFVVRRRAAVRTSLLLAFLAGCGSASVDVDSSDVTIEERADAMPEGDTGLPVGVDVSPSEEPVLRPRPPSQVPPARLPNSLDLTPQAVHDLPDAESITDRPHWRWVAKQPSLSKSRFIPSDTDSGPSMELNVAGDYVFELRAWEDAEELSEIVWTQKISVIPGPGFHVELLWETPGDPDETDEGVGAGSDLDLHFVHNNYAMGAGYDGDGDGIGDPWFNQPFDTFWFVPSPNWGKLDPAADDDPSLDRDDTDGAGPENLNLTFPQANATYGIGVHYWCPHGFGTAYATVRIYIDGVLIAERTQLVSYRDLWDVGTLHWPSGVFTPRLRPNGAHFVTPDYYMSQPCN